RAVAPGSCARCDAVRCDAVPCDAVPCDAVPCGAVRRDAARCVACGGCLRRRCARGRWARGRWARGRPSPVRPGFFALAKRLPPARHLNLTILTCQGCRTMLGSTSRIKNKGREDRRDTLE